MLDIDREHPISDSLNADDANKLYRFQQASLVGDKSLVAEMLRDLDKPAHMCYEYSLPHILARLGTTDALPILNTYILYNSESTLSNIAKASKARIVAEDTVKNMPDGKYKATTKIHVFLQGLGMTIADLNASLSAFQRPEVDASGRRIIKSGPRLRSLGVAATDEVADMIYNGSYQDYNSISEVSAISFQADYPAYLKMKMAPLSRPQRIVTMINDLAAKNILKEEDNYEIQLLSNEGLPASNIAAIKLREMEATRSQFAGAGLGAMIYVIAGVGDTKQLPLIRQLEKDADLTVANHAYIAAASLQQGSKRFSAWGY